MRTEIDRHRDAAAAVAIKEERGGAIARRVAPIDDRERNTRAIGGDGMETLADILRWIVAAEDWLLLQKRALASPEVVVVDRAWSDERFVLKTDVTGVEFPVFTDGRIIRRLGEFNAVRGSKKCGGGRS